MGRIMGDKEIPYIVNRPVVNEDVRNFGLRRFAWVILGVVTVWVLVVVFSRWESGVARYSAPEEVCGVNVSPAALAPLLPPGRDLEQYEPQTSPEVEEIVEFCRISVDREVALSFVAKYFPSLNRTVVETYEFAPGAYGISVPGEVLIGGEPAVLGHNGSLSRAMCPARGEEAVLQVNIKYFDAEGGSAIDEERELVKALTEEYLGAVAKRHGCA
ncbi:hypothetical protein GCM10009716_12320 [Streptomyces sodiiphilus]|uniref:Uncharacterized protein n=1 Tax=Streptomyces sodiiphilus TaxID=226217 RepID=A0ABN2NVZ8_9ACTN